METFNKSALKYTIDITTKFKNDYKKLLKSILQTYVCVI